MKKKLTLLTALLALAAGCSALRVFSSQDKKPEVSVSEGDAAKQAEVMKELRHKLLTTSDPDELGLSEEDAGAKTWGVLVDAASGPGVATLVSLRDGTSSLYTTTGGGVLGGYSAKDDARAVVVEAEKHLAQMRRTEEFPYPEAGRVKFYVLTPDGVLTAEAGLKELTGKRDELWPLFYAADKVLTRLRQARGETGPKE